MHPHLLYQLSQTRNDEIRQSARASATRPARSAVRRWPRWLRRTTTPPTGGCLVRDPYANAIRSSRPRITTNSVSAER
jgi:hypothetical protein